VVDDERVLVDPSLLLNEAVLAEFESVPNLIAASAEFRRQLSENQIGPSSPLLPPGQPYAAEVNRDRVLRFLDLDNMSLFSYERANLSDAESAVTRALQDERELAAAVYADEWAFLQSQSIMFAAVHQPIDAFRRAGSAVIEYGRRFLEEAIDVVVPEKSQGSYSHHRLILGGVVKWVVVGGAMAATGVFLPPAAVAGALAVPVVRALDP